ncbi:beta-propeller fold lactonase family protein [Alphaproteobacteria bacterium]|nr:beta-propeller fold lactonase family protein [Alphaproteobacteria bacterium]
MQKIDLRQVAPGEVFRSVIASYNKLAAGEPLEVTVQSYPTELQMGLVEAGAKHEAERTDDGDWSLRVRGASQSLSNAPGIHHVVAGRDGSIWTCQRSRRAARIDGYTRKIMVVREVATKASHMALDHERDRLFIADAGGNALVCVSANDLRHLGRWDMPGSPQLPLVTEEGISCITISGAAALGIVWPRGGGYHAKVIEVGRGPHDPVATPDGRSILVPCAGAGEVLRVSLSDGTITGRFITGDGPAHIAVHPDGERIYVANTFDGTLACISPEGDLLGKVASGRWAHVPEVTPDGRLVYVANFFDDTLSVFDARTLERLALLDTDAYPHGLDISPDGNSVVATGFSSDHVRVFDAVSYEEKVRIKVGEGSAHTAFLPDNRTAFVGCSISDHLAVIDIESEKSTELVKLN